MGGARRNDRTESTIFDSWIIRTGQIQNGETLGLRRLLNLAAQLKSIHRRSHAIHGILLKYNQMLTTYVQ